MSHETKMFLIYMAIGVKFFCFMAAHDAFCGRPVQKRDVHIVIFWPLVAAVALIIGMFEFSEMTSKDDGLKKPWRWVK